MYFLDDNTEKCGFYECKKCGYRFLSESTVKAGVKIYGRLEELCDGDICPENVNVLSDEQIRSCNHYDNKYRNAH